MHWLTKIAVAAAVVVVVIAVVAIAVAVIGIVVDVGVVVAPPPFALLPLLLLPWFHPVGRTNVIASSML